VSRFSVVQLIAVCAVLAIGPAIAGGNSDAGREKASQCVSCHGVEGEGVGENPPIAGQDPKDFVSVMRAYKTGEIEAPMMAMFVQGLSDEDIADLAAYYASLSREE